jgi:hypothetical protein
MKFFYKYIVCPVISFRTSWNIVELATDILLCHYLEIYQPALIGPIKQHDAFVYRPISIRDIEGDGI